MADELKWLWEASKWIVPVGGVGLVLYGLLARAPTDVIKHRNRFYLYFGLFELLPSSQLREVAGFEQAGAIDVLLGFAGVGAFVMAFRSLMRLGDSYEKPST